MSHTTAALRVRGSQGESERPTSHYESRRVRRESEESGRFRTGHCQIGAGTRDGKEGKRGGGGRVVTLPPCQGPKTVR